VTSLRHKLGPARLLIRTVRGVGYSLDEAVPAAEHAE
jgi:DNA-binding response OmpR family regulator